MNTDKSEFERLGEEKPPSLFREFTQFALENKKWWLLPIIVVLTLMSVLIVLTGTGAAPLVYKFF